MAWAAIGLAAAPTLAQDQGQDQFPELPALISADQITYDETLEVVTASGNVEISRNDRVLLADTISYNLRTEVVTASGRISLLEPSGEILFADYVELTGDLREGFVRDIRVLLTDRSRMAAADATRVGGNRTVMRNAVFSPCELCPEDPSRAPLWQLKAERVVHDQEERTISYENAWMEFFGVPVAYAPYFEHPDPTVKRKSGFLAPTVGSSDVLGATLQVPYFWAIGPDKDLTVAPILATKQAPVLAGEYRHLLPDGELELAGSGTIADRTKDNGTVEEDVVRGHIDSWGRFDINETWRWGFDFNRASDRTYLRRYNLGDDSDRTLTSAAFVEGFRGRNYMSVNNFLYQGLRRTDDNDQAPLILPMLDYNFVSEPGVAGGTYRMDANVLVLNRFEGRESRRVSVKGGWELPYTSPLGDVYSLGAYIQADGYWVKDFEKDQPDVVAPANGEDGLTGRIFPEVVLGWRYPWVSHQESFSQIVEPIAQAVVAPEGFNPGAIPNEDSLDFEFDDTNLFSLNRFPGRDRVDSGTRFDYGIDWTLLTENFGVANVFVGQSYQIDPNDKFGAGSGLDDNFSDYVGRVRIQPVDFVDFVYRFRLDKDDLTANRSELNARLGPPALNVQVGYLDLTDESDQLELASREELYVRLNSRLSEYWSAHVAHRRDLQEDRSLVSQIGVAYQDECFLIEAIARRSFFRDSDVEPDDSIFVRFVLKYLGEFGAS
ncbi:MAG: LPS-assembly protein LptD [Kiloniellales bacterium]